MKIEKISWAVNGYDSHGYDLKRAAIVELGNIYELR